jgi:CRISPR system Cascade subunit CasC
MLARVNASVRVAHAFTVHSEQNESDYFSAVDDLAAQDGELGSGHINNSELTSGLYYGYVVVDVPTLVANLTGVPQKDWLSADRSLAAKLIESLVQTIATVTPGAKLGSTAPYAYAQCVLIEAGDAQPRSLSGAFLQPVSLRGDVLREAYGALDEHLSELDAMYGREGKRWIAALRAKDHFATVAERIVGSGESPAIKQLAALAAAAVKG